VTAREELLALAARVEALTGPCRETDAEIAVALRDGVNLPYWAIDWDGEWWSTIKGSVVLLHSDGRQGPHFTSRDYTASLDAAMTLVPKGLMAAVARFSNGQGHANIHNGRDIDTTGIKCSSATAVLALTAAALRARAAMVPE
jgi:hypothetical protein